MSDLISVETNQSIFGERSAELAPSRAARGPKWPGWVRLVVILGLSAGLWTLIFLAISSVIG